MSLPLAVSAGVLSDMDGGWALVVAAIVTAVGGILVAVIQQARRQDSAEHALLTEMVRKVFAQGRTLEIKIDQVDETLKKHLESHAKQEVLDNGKRVDKNRVEKNKKVAR